MPKATSPLFSSIRGTLKGGATFRANPQTDAITMQTKPVPTGAPTAKQAAVRAAYSRLAYLWKNLSNLDKEPYQLIAIDKNITTWNAFLAFHMPIMTKTPLLYIPSAEGTGLYLQDFAINGDTFTKNGAAWQDLNTFPCLRFDGIDDSLLSSRKLYYDAYSDFTYFGLITPEPNRTNSAVLIGSRASAGALTGFMVSLSTNGNLNIRYGNGTSNVYKIGLSALPTNTLCSVGLIKSGTSLTFYANGVSYPATGEFATITQRNESFIVYGTYYNYYSLKGKGHIAALFPRVLTVADLNALDAHYRKFYS